MVRQARTSPVDGESLVDLASRDPLAPFGEKQRGVLRGGIAGPDIGHVFLDDLGRPWHHRGDLPPRGDPRIALP